MIDCREDNRPCKFGKMHKFRLIVREGVLIYGCKHCGIQHRRKTPWDSYKLTPKRPVDFSAIGSMEFTGSDFTIPCRFGRN